MPERNTVQRETQIRRRSVEPRPVRGPQPRRMWTREELGRLVELRDEHGMGWKEIAQALNRTIGQCNSKYNYGHQEAARTSYDAGSNHKCSDEQLAERERRAQARDQRDITQTFFGDPPPGYSALDQRRQSV